MMTWNPVDGNTRLVGSIGWSVGPWSSLQLYNAAFSALGLNWRCVPLHVAKGRLREALVGLQALGFAGAELAEPYQRDALPYLDKLSPAAEITGVVNYITVDQQDRLVGDNTRWLGFLATLHTLVPSLNELRPLIIGAGAGARSIVYALTHEGLPSTILDSQIDQAVDLVRCLRHVLHEHSFSVYRWPQDLERVASDATLIVNATGEGTWPDADHSPWPDEIPFPPNALVFDLVTWPNESRFLRQARASGARTVGGQSLLVSEVATTFERWTGQPAPIEAMWQVARDAMMGRLPQELLWPQNGVHS
jgi:shikimate dehydrogenase